MKPTPKRRLHWKRLLSLSFCLLLLVAGALWLGLSWWQNRPLPPSPFAGLLPAATPLALEGSPRAVAQVLRQHCDLVAEFAQYQNLADDPQIRILVAILPNAQGVDPLCQTYLSRLASQLEETWNKERSYPQQFQPSKGCPHQGKTTYQSDGATFTLTCQGPQHRSLYNSRSGLALAQPTPSTAQAAAPSNLPERGERAPEKVAAQRLAELQDNPRVAQAIAQGDLSSLAHSQWKDSQNPPPVSFYQDSLTLAAPQAAPYLERNQPLSLQELPQVFKLKEPFFIAIANLTAQAPNCFTLPAYPQLQLWSPHPQAIQELLKSTPAQPLTLASPAQTELQVAGDAQSFQTIFSQWPVRLPAGVTFNFWRQLGVARHYEGRLRFPAEYRASLQKLAASLPQTSELALPLVPRAAGFFFTRDLQELFSLPDYGWNSPPADAPQRLAFTWEEEPLPELHLSVRHWAQSWQGRRPAQIALSFAGAAQRQAWQKAHDSRLPAPQGQEDLLSWSTAPNPSSPATMTLPQGPSPLLWGGWWRQAQPQAPTLSWTFAGGVLPPASAELPPSQLWFKVEGAPESGPEKTTEPQS